MIALIILLYLLCKAVYAVIPPDPLITAAAHLVIRDNGANVIGYELDGAIWNPRSCATGYFSTSGTLGNCCTNDACVFLTACSGSYVYSAGGSANCGNLCGTGTIYHTAGDRNPLSMFNCNSDWIVTMTTALGAIVTPSPSSTSRTLPTSTSTAPLPTNTGSSSSNKSGIIAGATVGGLAVVGAVVVAILFICLKHKRGTPPRPPAHFAQPTAQPYAAAAPVGASPYTEAQYPQNQYGYHPEMTGTTTSPTYPGQQWNPYKPPNVENPVQELPTQNT